MPRYYEILYTNCFGEKTVLLGVDTDDGTPVNYTDSGFNGTKIIEKAETTFEAYRSNTIHNLTERKPTMKRAYYYDYMDESTEPTIIREDILQTKCYLNQDDFLYLGDFESYDEARKYLDADRADSAYCKAHDC